MTNLQTRLQASQTVMHGLHKMPTEPKLIIGYTPKLLVDPYLPDLGYAAIRKSMLKHITVDVALTLDYSQNKKKQVADACLAAASFENLSVNTPYPNKHYLVGYVPYHQKRLNEILWGLDVDLKECLRKTGYDRKNGKRSTDLSTMTPFLRLNVQEKWHIYEDTFTINREFPVSLLRDGYAENGDEQQALYHKVQRHWEVSDGFELRLLTSSDRKSQLVTSYQTVDKTLPALLLANFDGSLIKLAVKTDLKDADDSVVCGLDEQNRPLDAMRDYAIYFPRHDCVAYANELLACDESSHLIKQFKIAPQAFAWSVKSTWEPLSGK